MKVPTTVTSIGDQAFQDCTNLTTLDLSSTQVRTIGQGAFANTTKLETLKVPNTLTTLNSASTATGNNITATFYNSAIKELDLSNAKITTIAESTFDNATKLETVKLPAGVTSIGNKAFYGTTALKTLTQQSAPSTLDTPGVGDREAIGQEERSTTTPTKNKLTSSITTISTRAFQGTGLEQIDLSDVQVTTSLGNSVFQQATNLSNLELPSGLTTIPAGMVAGATSLTSLKIPSGVAAINGGNADYPGAFEGSGIQNIDLSGTKLATWQSSGDSVADVGTFSYMKGLTGTVKLPLSLSTNSGLAKDAFKNSPQLQEIEFVLNNAGNLNNTNASFKANLKKIYEMFAGGSSDFTVSSDLTATNNWLPQTPSTGASQPQAGETTSPSSVAFAGITWTVAKITNTPAPADSTSGSSSIGSDTTQVTITGTVATGTGTTSTVGPFKYKYTTPQGTLSNNSQTLPSNVKTIKITLNKG